MSVDMKDLAQDMRAEAIDLAAVVRSVDDPLERPTPSPGWTVRDQITHLAFFDDIAAIAVADPERFVALRDGIPDVQEYVDAALTSGHGRSTEDLLAWFADGRDQLATMISEADSTGRVPWFGPDMTVASKGTARIMETWAHGQDVVDALGARRTPTNRLRHVAHIGVRSLPNSFRINGSEVPDQPLRVELRAPDDTLWEWGAEDAAERVTGPALDFCLVLTQRRHLSDTELHVVGDVARQWLQVAQAYAGAPGAGRPPSDSMDAS